VAAWAPASFAAGGGIHKIKHVVVIMQENRSFDSYFGPYPGADGIPMRNGQPAVCAPDPLRGGCVRPYHDHRDVNFGGPHENAAFQTDLDQGRMDGFVRAHQTCTNPLDPRDCVATIPPDMMGYHDAREIPNYWSYARNYVLQDHMFEPNASWSLPAHLFLTSEWSARCSLFGDPLSCTSNIEIPQLPTDIGTAPHNPPDYLDGPDVAAAPLERQLGVLPQEGQGAGLRDGRDVLPIQGPGSADAGYLEPAAVVRHGQTGQSAGQHQADVGPVQRAARQPAAGGLLGDPQWRRERAPDLQHQRGAGVRDRRDQRDHALTRLELDRDLPHLGRLGRLL
jgi:hypothetical protein